MRDKTFEPTKYQQDLMLQAVGPLVTFDFVKVMDDQAKNYYVLTEPVGIHAEAWEELERHGFVYKGIQPNRSIIYHLTKKGLTYLRDRQDGQTKLSTRLLYLLGSIRSNGGRLLALSGSSKDRDLRTLMSQGYVAVGASETYRHNEFYLTDKGSRLLKAADDARLPREVDVRAPEYDSKVQKIVAIVNETVGPGAKTIEPPKDEIPVLLRFARYYATQKHKDQAYSGGLPYTHHLAQVESVLLRYGFDELVLRVASWLHDVVEDTETKIKDVAELFGDEVALLVGAVTNEPGENRKVRSALTYPKIRKAGTMAIALKLADRIANLSNGGKLVEMYRNEYADFRHGIMPVVVEDMRLAKMWEDLDAWAAGKKTF